MPIRRPTPPAPYTTVFVALLLHALAAAGCAVIPTDAAPDATVSPAPRSRAVVAADTPWTAAPVGQFGGSTWAMAVDRDDRDGIVWLAHGPRVVAIDAHDPAAPTVVGRSEWMDRVVTALAVDGPTGVALTGFPSDQPEEEALHTLDLTDPSAPRAVARLPLDGAANVVALANGMAYVVRETYDPMAQVNPYRHKLVAVDVRDPAAPRVVNADVAPAPSDVIDVRVAGRALAVTASEPVLPLESGDWRQALRVFDLADPAHPALAALVEDEAWCRLGEGPGAERDGVVYGYGHSGGIVAMDVSVPAAPREVRRWTTDSVVGGGVCDNLRQPLFLIDEAGLPYLATPDSSSVAGGWLFAVGPPGAPGRRPLHALTLGPTAAAIVGLHVLVADSGGDITVIDTRPLAAGEGTVEVAGTLRLLGATSAIAVREDVADSRLYAALGHGGISVLSLDRPLDSPVTGRFVDNLERTTLHVAGGWAAAGRIGLATGQRTTFVDEAEVIDVTEPTSPRFHSAHDEGRFARVLTTPGGDWLVHGRSGSTGPRTAPVLSPIGDPPGRADAPLPLDMRLYDGVVIGERFVAVGVHPPQGDTPDCTAKRFVAFDLSDPTVPRREGQLDLGPCRAGRPNLVVAGAGDIAYVGDATYESDPSGVVRSELTIVALGAPAAPRIIAQLPLSGTVTSLAQRDGYVFANAGRPPDGRPSVIVVDARIPSEPRVIGVLDIAGTPTIAGGRVYVNTGQTGVWVFEPPLSWRRPRGEAWLALPWVGARAGP